VLEEVFKAFAPALCVLVKNLMPFPPIICVPPYLFHPSGALIYEDLAVIADLHIGLEENALATFRVSTRHMLERVGRLREEGVKVLVLNGDIKHSFGKETSQEWEEIRLFIDRVKGMGMKVVAVKGNHDNYIANILRGEAYDVFTYGPLTITHGHLDVDVKPYTVIGNEHPALKIRDEVGSLISLPAFVEFPEGLIVLPAFNPLVKGSDVRSWPSSALSPALEKVNVDEGKVYAISNWEEVLYFGTISFLRERL